MKKLKKKFVLPELEIDYNMIETIDNFEPILMTNEILKLYKLEVDKTKIEEFKDINFVSVFKE